MEQLSLSITDESFNINLMVNYEDLLDGILVSLKGYLMRGNTIQTTLTYSEFPGEKTKTTRRNIIDNNQLLGWRDEIKELLISLRSGKARSANNSIQIIMGDINETFSLDRRDGKDRRAKSSHRVNDIDQRKISDRRR